MIVIDYFINSKNNSGINFEFNILKAIDCYYE